MPSIGIAVLRALVASNTIFCLACMPAWADPAPERAEMNACIQKHFTPADMTVVRRLTLVMLATGLNDDPVAASVQSKRDGVLNDAGQLVTRLTETDCKAEIHAVAVSGVKGAGFGALFQQLMAQTQPAIVRAGAVLGLDLVKRLDSSVLLDLGGGDPVAAAAAALNGGSTAGPASGSPGAAPASPLPSGPQHFSRSTVSGTRLQVAFETALNPDCSVIGNTVIRIQNAPTHGKASIESGNGFTNFAPNTQRYACNEKRRPGAFLYYQSDSKYSGPDSLSYQVIFPDGTQLQVSTDISVN